MSKRRVSEGGLIVTMVSPGFVTSAQTSAGTPSLASLLLWAEGSAFPAYVAKPEQIIAHRVSQVPEVGLVFRRSISIGMATILSISPATAQSGQWCSFCALL